MWEIEVLEAKLEELKEELNNPEYQSDYSKLTEVQSEIDSVEEELMEEMELWEHLMNEMNGNED